MGLPRGAAGIDNVNALVLSVSDCQVRVSDATEESAALLFEAVFIFVGALGFMLAVAAASAVDSEVDVVIEQDCQIRLKIAAQNFVQLQNGLRSEFAAAALIGFGGVGKSVAENNLSLGECGQNHLVNMLRARGEHQRHFGIRRQAGGCGVQNHFANLLAGRGATGFARDNHGYAACA